MDSLISLANTIIAGIVAFLAVASGFYIWWIYRQRHEDAPFLALLVRLSVVVSAAAGAGLIYLALAVTGLGLGRPWGGVFLTAIFVAMMLVPIEVARIFRRERKRP